MTERRGTKQKTHLRRHFLAIGRLVAQLSAKMAGGGTLLHLVLGHLGHGWQFEARMHVLACRTVRTEAGQVIGAQHTAYMPMPTMWPMTTEAPVIPGTVFDFALRIDVQKWALFVVARIESRIEIAFGHLRHIVFVQEFTLIALFAQAAQPMFAHDCPVAANVPKRTRGALLTLRTVGAVEELAHGCC